MSDGAWNREEVEEVMGNDHEVALANVLVQILEWPLPNGHTVETGSLPPWLAARARGILKS